MLSSFPGAGKERVTLVAVLLFPARPGRGQARPGRGHASNVKRIGTRDKARLIESRNYVILLLKSQEG